MEQAVGPGPSNVSNDAGSGRRPYVSCELGTDLVLTVAGLITQQHSPFYDDADLARDAAACACIGNSTFTEIGEAIFCFLSPRFGENPNVTMSSSVSQLKSVLKSWGRKTGGNKSELLQRIQDEVAGEGDRDADEEPLRALCPIAIGPKRRIREQQAARITKTKAKEVYGVYASQLQNLTTQYSFQSAFGACLTYAVRDVKVIARKTYKDYASLRKSQQSSKDFMANYNATRDDRSSRVIAVLSSRGVGEDEAKRATGHLWHLSYFTESRFGNSASDGITEEWLRLGAETAADEAQTWLFHMTRTNFAVHYMRLRANHVYAKASKYKQDVMLEKKAFTLGLQDWVEGRTLQDVQTHPALPRHLRGEAERAWQAAQRAQ